MKNRRLTTVAGILILTAAIFNILWLTAAFTRILDIKELLHTTWVITPFPYIILDIGFGGNTDMASVVAIVFLLEILLSVIGGVFAMRRKAWGLALTGSVGAFICIPFLGITAIILTVMSKGQFIGQEKQQ